MASIYIVGLARGWACTCSLCTPLDISSISCEPDMLPTSVFFISETAVNTASKVDSKSVESCPARFSAQKKLAFEQKAYLCISVMQALLSLYFLYMGFFHQLMVSSPGHGKTNKYAYKHTNTLFGKTISEIQARRVLIGGLSAVGMCLV